MSVAQNITLVMSTWRLCRYLLLLSVDSHEDPLMCLHENVFDITRLLHKLFFVICSQGVAMFSL